MQNIADPITKERRRIDVPSAIHIIACAAAATWLMMHVGPASAGLYEPLTQPLVWRAIWCAAFVALALAVRWPVVGLLVLVCLHEGVPRYFPPHEVMLKTGMMNWASALAATAWACHLMRGRARGLEHHPGRVVQAGQPHASGTALPGSSSGTALPGRCSMNLALPNQPVSWLMLALIVWVIVCLFAALLRGQPWCPAVHHHPDRFAHALVAFVLAAQLLRTSRHAWWFCLVFCVSLCARAFLYGDIGPTPQFGGGDSDISAMAVIAMPFALLGAHLTRARWGKIAFLGVLLALLLILNETRNRGAAVAFLLMLAALWFVSHHRKRALLIAAPVLAVIIILFFTSPYWTRFTNIYANTLDGQTVNTRLIVWQASWRMTQAHPLFGVGPGAFQRVADLYLPGVDELWQLSPTKVPAEFRDQPLPAAHNSLLHMTSETGLLGGAIYLGVFVWAMVMAVKIRRRAAPAWPAPAASMVFAALCAYLAISLFLSRHDMLTAYLLAGWVAGIGRGEGNAKCKACK